jgi:hypothetical protein
MIVLTKKKILSVLGGMFLLIVTIAYANNIKYNKKTVETVNVPVTNKVIVLDAGHGKPDERS